ncbi:MAG TPA: septal ring lytic transglycosylase RlpA family protein [Thermodesulfobacteriota bacterium]|nr:septal ring lytic transglycosylase RlpA family protein [Thermodesulfobacteriota bacterium]
MKKSAKFMFLLIIMVFTFFPLSGFVYEKQEPETTNNGRYTIGVASWYGKYFHGKETASGEPFNMYDYTAAHRSLPLGTKVKVTNLENGKDVTVDINDRGPYVDGRTIDLSYAAAKSIGITDSGISEVKIEIVSKPNT